MSEEISESSKEKISLKPYESYYDGYKSSEKISPSNYSRNKGDLKCVETADYGILGNKNKILDEFNTTIASKHDNIDDVELQNQWNEFVLHNTKSKSKKIFSINWHRRKFKKCSKLKSILLYQYSRNIDVSNATFDKYLNFIDKNKHKKNNFIPKLDNMKKVEKFKSSSKSKNLCLPATNDIEVILADCINIVQIRQSLKKPIFLSGTPINYIPNFYLENRMKAIFYDKINDNISGTYTLIVKYNHKNGKSMIEADEIITLFDKMIPMQSNIMIKILEINIIDEKNSTIKLFGYIQNSRNIVTRVLYASEIFEYIESKRDEIKNVKSNWEIYLPLKYKFNLYHKQFDAVPSGFTKKEWLNSFHSIPKWNDLPENINDYRPYVPVASLGMKGLADRKKILINRVKDTEKNISELKSKIKLSVDKQIEIFNRINMVEETYKNLYTRMIKIVTLLWLNNDQAPAYIKDLYDTFQQITMSLQSSLKNVEIDQLKNQVDNFESKKLLEETRLENQLKKLTKIKDDDSASTIDLMDLVDSKLKTMEKSLKHMEIFKNKLH